MMIRIVNLSCKLSALPTGFVKKKKYSKVKEKGIFNVVLYKISNFKFYIKSAI